MCRFSASTRLRSRALATISSTLTGSRRLDRIVVLQPRQVDDLLDKAGEPTALLLHPPGEPAHGLRVVARVEHRLGQQAQCADRRLELVGDVGDEVPADLVDPDGLGPVLDEGKQQPGSQRRDARRDVKQLG